MKPIEKTIVQKIKRKENDEYLKAEKYYSLLSAINELKLTKRELELLAFTAIKGNISYSSIREEFCKRYDTTSPTVNNMISRLKKIGVMVKDGTKVKVNPVIVLDFSADLLLEIKLTNG